MLAARCAALLAALHVVPLLAQTPARLAAAPLAIALESRTLTPGELVVFTMTPARPMTTVRVRVFDRSVTAFRVDDRVWKALIGIDLDRRPGSYVAEVEATNGDDVLRAAATLAIKRRSFPIRTLRVEPDFVNPSPELLTRIDDEREFTRSVYSRSAAMRLWSSPFVRPVPQPANSSFGTRSVFNGERRSPHAGTDFRSPTGTPVVAPNAGHVVAARELFYTGNTVIIDHGLGVFSMLAHLSRIDVHEGESVAAGQLVGLVGATGRVTGPHLHWALSVAGARVDPLSLLALLGH